MSKKSEKQNNNLKKKDSPVVNDAQNKNSKRKKLDFEGNTKREGEGSMYDKIMRENLLDLFLPLVQEELNVKIKSIQPFPDKQPTTVIRETDSFLLVTTYSEIEPQFILHIEFESGDDEEMIYRVSEHHGIELRKHKLPIKHVVVYLGETKPKMRTQLRKEEIFEGFTLVNAHDFSPTKWLEEEEPSKIIMAILSDYRKQNAAIILEAIMNKLRQVCKSDTELKKFIEQLILISSPDSYRERNLEELTIKISKAMPITIDIEKDYLYKLGLKKTENILRAFKAKAAEEKAVLEAKIAEEKAKIKVKKKASTRKMKSKKILSEEEIMEFLNLDKKTFKEYWKEILEDRKG